MKRSAPGCRLVVLPFALLIAAGAVACSSEEEPPQIRVREADLIIQNRTSTAWSNVEVWVNDYFRGVAPSLQPAQQLTVPLNQLQGPYGRTFDRNRQPVHGVLVTARAADGTNVRLTWGKVWRK